MKMVHDNSGGIGLAFLFSTNSLTLKEEAFLYPFTSFLAEFGGSLGLFLGISFLTIWDALLKLFSYILQFKK